MIKNVLGIGSIFLIIAGANLNNALGHILILVGTFINGLLVQSQ